MQGEEELTNKERSNLESASKYKGLYRLYSNPR